MESGIMAKLYVTHKVHPGQKCRVHTWIDTKNLVEKFGIEAKVGARYAHVIKEKRVWLFDSREECVKAIAALAEAAHG
jgi:hypothetical protein